MGLGNFKIYCFFLSAAFFGVLGCANIGNQDGPSVPPGGLEVCPMSDQAPSVTSVGSITVMDIKPSATNICITAFDSEHSVYVDSAATKKNKLVVFLPGTESTAGQIHSFFEEGARRGYHVIGLNYPNQNSVNSLCNASGNTDLGCFGKVHEEVTLGQDVSPLVAVDEHNSIEGRLAGLLEYLIRFRAGEGWDQFYVGGTIQWSLISVAGHSQGGGHAAYIGKIHSVFRVSMYSAVSDYNNTAGYPTWFAMASQTSSDKFYGFIHDLDFVANSSLALNQVPDAWADPAYFNMAGALTNIDSLAPPYNNSHRLSSNQYNSSGLVDRHIATIRTGYEAVWDYMTFP